MEGNGKIEEKSPQNQKGTQIYCAFGSMEQFRWSQLSKTPVDKKKKGGKTTGLVIKLWDTSDFPHRG